MRRDRVDVSVYMWVSVLWLLSSALCRCPCPCLSSEGTRFLLFSFVRLLEPIPCPPAASPFFFLLASHKVIKEKKKLAGRAKEGGGNKGPVGVVSSLSLSHHHPLYSLSRSFFFIIPIIRCYHPNTPFNFTHSFLPSSPFVLPS